MPDDQKELDRGPKELDRGPKELDRGPKELDRGSPNDVVLDVFNRVSGLGGLLVVAFVAPVPAATNGSSNGRSPRNLAISALARKAEARDQEASAAQREAEDEDTRRLAAAIRELMAQERARPRT